MNKNSLLVVAVVTAATVLIVRQQFQISDLRKALAEKPEVETVVQRVEVPVERAVATRAKSSDARISDEAEEAFRAAAVSPLNAAPAAQAPEQKKGLDLGAMMKTVSSMMTNPAMKGMMLAQADMQMEMQYGRLFKYLNLPPEKAAALKKLMMDRQEAMMTDGMAFLEGGLTKENMEARGKAVKEKKDAFDKQIAELLGTEDYDSFKQFEETQPERQQVDMLKHSLSASGEPLTEQQEYDLVNKMYSARTNSPSMAMLSKQDTPDPAMFTGAGMTNVMAQMEKQQEQNLAIAAGILTPAQNEQYKKFAEQQKAMQKLGMEMATQMFGGASNVQGAPANVQVQTIAVP